MALATQCPHCAKTFRVAADQLKLRGGIVRCGECQQIFDGNAHLIELDLPPPPAPVPELPIATDVPEIADEAPPLDDDHPVYTLDFSSTFDPFGILPGVAEPELAPEPEPVPEPEPILEPEPASIAEPEPPAEAVPAQPVDIAGGALPLLRQATAAGTVAEPGPVWTPRVAPPSKSRSMARARTGASRSHATLPEPRVEPKVAPDPDEPEFLRRGRELERTSHKRRIAMLAGSVGLALLLAFQAATTLRNPLAARFPGLNLALGALCRSLGCKVELPMQIDALSIETGELQTIGTDTFSLVTLLRNQSALTQAWPYIELELTDGADKPLVRRVFAPKQYLAAQRSAAGFNARSEQPVKLHFQLKDVKASGYHIAVFYP